MWCGTISFVGTLVLLFEIDNKPLKNWIITNADITPNALVSVLSTVTKTAILLPIAEGISQLEWTYFQQRPHRLADLQMFDEASRGPWGAVILMLRVRTGAVVATIGAILTLLTLAMDRFSQQVLSYPLRTVAANNMTATISRSDILWNGIGNGHKGERSLFTDTSRLKVGLTIQSLGSFGARCVHDKRTGRSLLSHKQLQLASIPDVGNL